ncbi:TldD/PmbA family protein [Candidatus Bipolaricaulota bacterium]|nr:TldD/PmbA family protein [Candidatus Bipolaricaulota bacterium]
MRELLRQAEARGWQAEVYWVTRDRCSVQFRLGQPVAVLGEVTDFCMVRVIRKGRLGMACGTRPGPELIKTAGAAAGQGGEAGFSFAAPTPHAELPPPHPELPGIGAEDLVPLGARIVREIAGVHPKAPLVVSLERTLDTLRIAASGGLEREARLGRVQVSFGAPFPGAGSGLYKTVAYPGPPEFPAELVEEFSEWYGWGREVASPPPGRLPVLLAPEAAFLLALPLAAGLSGEALWQRTSPLLGKEGERILSDSLTIWDDPMREGDPFTRAFDDEGVPCHRRPLVEAGVLRGYLYDLRTAALLGEASTGNGFKRALFGGGPWASPNPWPARPVIQAGKTPWRELLALERGLLLYGGMGFHSSNYLQGQFSVQGLGFYIEDGRPVGRLSGTMVAGNIYQELAQPLKLSRERRELPGVVAPFILVSALQVAGSRG